LLQQAGVAPFERLDLTAGACRVRLGEGLEYDLLDLAGNLKVDPAGSALTASYRPEADSAPARCELELVRRHEDSASVTSLALRTVGEATCPARLLDPFFSTDAWLGAGARLRGELALEQRGAGDWSARFTGSFQDVDLRSLVRRVSPEQTMTGRATLRLDEARWGELPGRGPGWVAARGVLEVPRGGVLPRTLVTALGAQLGFRTTSAAGTDRPEVDYAALGVAFALRPDGTIQLDGALGPGYAAGAVAVTAARFAPLLLAPEGVGSVSGLVRALVPGDLDRPETLIPARSESLAIQRFLPAPAQLAGQPSLPAAHAN
jgi:hypothetical protein